MNSSDYNKYLALIKQLNNASAEKDAYKSLYNQLVSSFGFQDSDVQRLIKNFRFSLASLGL